MEMFLRDQQLVTLLLYLNYTCIFAANVDEMLDWIEMVFKRPKDFNFKINQRNAISFNAV